MPTCYRHPERETYIRCQRCDRPICPDCMRDAAVGFHCPACGPTPEDLVATETPAPRALRSRPAVPGDATRTAASRLVEPGFLRDRLVDDRCVRLAQDRADRSR